MSAGQNIVLNNIYIYIYHEKYYCSKYNIYEFISEHAPVLTKHVIFTKRDSVI